MVMTFNRKQTGAAGVTTFNGHPVTDSLLATLLKPPQVTMPNGTYHEYFGKAASFAG
jgi:hypothetical protein